MNGLNATSKSKKEMLDRLPQLPLFSPLLLLDLQADGSSPSQNRASAAAGTVQPQPQVPPIGQEAMAALGWLAHTSAAAATSMGGGSCCALPPVRIQLPSGMQAPTQGWVPAGAAADQAAVPCIQQPGPLVPAAAAAAPVLLPAQPADSQATMASAGAAAQAQRQLQGSPEVGQQQWRGQANGVPLLDMAAPTQQGAAAAVDASAVPVEQQGASAPEWLVQGIAGVSERSQGSRDIVEGRQLLGRRWVGGEGLLHALTLLETLCAGLGRCWSVHMLHLRCLQRMLQQVTTHSQLSSPLITPRPNLPPPPTLLGWRLCCWTTLSRTTRRASPTRWRRGCRRASEHRCRPSAPCWLAALCCTAALLLSWMLVLAHMVIPPTKLLPPSLRPSLPCRVVEPVGVDHDEDCPPGCTQRHAFFYVR